MNVLSNIIVSATDGRPTRGHHWRTHKMLVDTPPSAVLLAPLEDERILFARVAALKIRRPAVRRCAWMHEQLLARFPAWDPSMSTSGRDGWRSPVTRDRISAWPTTPSPTAGIPEPAWQCPPIAQAAGRRWRARPSTPAMVGAPFLRSKSRRYASSINARHTATSHQGRIPVSKETRTWPSRSSIKAQPPTAWRASAPSACDVGTARLRLKSATPDPGKAHVRPSGNARSANSGARSPRAKSCTS